MNIVNLLLVGAGGFLGSIARYLTVLSVERRISAILPYGTLIVNVVGSFLLGLIVAAIMKKSGGYGAEWKLFLGTGFCGGFTTFSAFSVENMILFQQRLPGSAMLYIVLSIIGGLAAVWSGYALAKNIF